MSWGGGGIDASSASTSKEDNWIVYSSGKKAVEKVIVHPLVLLFPPSSCLFAEVCTAATSGVFSVFSLFSGGLN